MSEIREEQIDSKNIIVKDDIESTLNKVKEENQQNESIESPSSSTSDSSFNEPGNYQENR